MISPMGECLLRPEAFLPELTRISSNDTGAFGDQQDENRSAGFRLGQRKAWTAGHVLNGTIETIIAWRFIDTDMGHHGAHRRRESDIQGINRAIEPHSFSFINLTVPF